LSSDNGARLGTYKGGFHTLRSRALIFLSAITAAILIGCGGGGGGKSSTVTTGTTGVPGATQPGDSIEMVNLPAPSQPAGRINVAYLPLQGRGLSDLTVTLRNIEFALGAQSFIEPLASPVTFITNGNQVQQKSASVPVVDGNSQRFDTFDLNVDTVTDVPNNFTVGSTDSPFINEMPFPASISVFPSRESTMPVFLNDGMFNIVEPDPVAEPPITESITFLPDVFTSANGSPMNGFISDFLSFDISQMGAKRPLMSTGAVANRVYFSGDKFAFSVAGPSGYFEMLTEDATHPKAGEFQDPAVINNIQTPGVWRTQVPDPTDPTHTAQITELFGIFRFMVDPAVQTRSMVINTGSFEVITMPKTPDDDTQQILLIAFNGNKATNMYWGDAHFSSGNFVAFPLNDLASGSAVGAIQGTLSGFLNKNAAPVTIGAPTDTANVRYGRYAIQGTVPVGFNRSGRFVVFRT
jgi:hypothetical protein